MLKSYTRRHLCSLDLPWSGAEHWSSFVSAKIVCDFQRSRGTGLEMRISCFHLTSVSVSNESGEIKREDRIPKHDGRMGDI